MLEYLEYAQSVEGTLNGSVRVRNLELGGSAGAYGERVQREPITEVWGQSPQWGPGAKPLVRGSGGRSPPEADDILRIETQIS